MDRETWIDRWGDRSMRVTASLLRNPALTIGGATVILFAVVRIPTEIFYRQFGLRPEEVGLDSVQVLLQGASVVLAFSFFIGIAYGFIAVIAIHRGPFGKHIPQLPLSQAVRSAARIAPLVVPVLSIVVAVTILSAAAIRDAGAIEDGRAPPSRFMPWRATRVEPLVRHRASDPPIRLSIALLLGRRQWTGRHL